jgi:hypothetical protein
MHVVSDTHNSRDTELSPNLYRPYAVRPARISHLSMVIDQPVRLRIGFPSLAQPSLGHGRWPMSTEIVIEAGFPGAERFLEPKATDIGAVTANGTISG